MIFQYFSRARKAENSSDYAIPCRAKGLKYSLNLQVKCYKEQEISQTRDECPHRNWSSIRHIFGKIAVI